MLWFKKWIYDTYKHRRKNNEYQILQEDFEGDMSWFVVDKDEYYKSLKEFNEEKMDMDKLSEKLKRYEKINHDIDDVKLDIEWIKDKLNMVKNNNEEIAITDIFGLSIYRMKRRTYSKEILEEIANLILKLLNEEIEKLEEDKINIEYQIKKLC